MEKPNQLSRLAKYAWIVLAYTVLVILWGAFVRATGSGAGCGSHWPTCNGDVIPRPESIETLIEFSHRLTSAILGPMVIGLVVWAWRTHGFSHRITKGAIWTFVFVLIEGGIGAGIVLFEYVADNPSSARAVWMGAHLVNTLILLAITTATAWWASGGPAFRLRNNRTIAGMLAVGLFMLLIVGAFGAITALGDTLFPAESFLEGATAKFDPEAHFSVKARLWHPTIAVGTVIYLLVIFWTTEEFWASAIRSRWTKINIALLIAQILGGIVNVLLAAPIWMQIVHLLMADLSWIALIILGIESLATAEVTEARAEPSVELPSFSTGD
ncbi:MAG: COX15/CtaA family protein [Anaerolineae bacterium]